MSSLLVSSQTLSEIADFIYYIFHSSNELGLLLDRNYSLISSIGKEWEEKEIYQKLKLLNETAISDEYDIAVLNSFEEDGIDGYVYSHLCKPLKYSKEGCIIEEWHFVILKRIDFFLYQSMNESSSQLYKGLEKLKNDFQSFMMQNLKEYRRIEVD